ncbi:MAG: T9SS type A sorting domain-containing protein [Bacteroidota bacterium]
MNRKFTLLVLLICLISGSVSAQVMEPFKPRKSPYLDNKPIISLRGDFQMIGNTNLTLKNYSDNGNNAQHMVYVDKDGDPATLNSSSATLVYPTGDEGNGTIDPACTNVVYAGLYWMGRAHNSSNSPNTFYVGSKHLDKLKVRFKHSGDTYRDVTAQNSNIYFPTNSQDLIYTGYADVTEYVRQKGAGEYFVADIALNQGKGGSAGYFGGWGLIVVYENSKMKWRDITIFDGYAYIYGPSKDAYELPVSGFRTAKDGHIDMRLGIIAGEGDVDINRDYFQIQRHGGGWEYLKHDNNDKNNFFNSSIPASNPRNPKLKNNTGIDIAMFKINNTGNSIIANNQTSTKFRYGSQQDTYVISCIAMSVDAYVPDVQGHIFITATGGVGYTPGSPVLPGQEIEYELKITNPSEERILGVSMDIPIPYTAEIVPGSYVATYSHLYSFPHKHLSVVDTAGAKILRWKIGDLPKAGTTELAKLKFKLKATKNCFYLVDRDNCLPKVQLEGKISGKGEMSGKNFSDIKFISGYEDGNCHNKPIYAPLSININAADFVNKNCPQEPKGKVTRRFEFCETPGINIHDSIAKIFPPVSKFFNNVIIDNVGGVDVAKPAPGATEYTHANDFPKSSADIGTKKYYVIPFGSSSCRWEIEIDIRPCNYWVGSNSTDWGTNSNWTKTRVPKNTEDVVFATTANSGKNAVKNLVLDQDRTITKLVNETNFATIIPTGKALTVKESIVGSETKQKAGKIVICSEKDKPNGTLIVRKQPAATPVYATVEMYSKADQTSTPNVWTDNIPGSPTNGQTFTSTYRWQYFGVPVESVQANPTFYGAYIRMYDEKYNGDNKRFFQKWRKITNNDNLTAFKGYEITRKTPETYSIQGKLFFGTKALDLSRKAPAVTTYTGTDLKLKHYGLGYNIFGNSYTAAIDIKQMKISAGLEQTVYIYNTGNFSEWAHKQGTTNTDDAGAYIVVPKNVAPIMGIDRIPSMQGFLMKFLESERIYNKQDLGVVIYYNGVGVNPKSGVTNNNKPQRAPTYRDSKEAEAGYIKVFLTGETSSDILWLIETPEATDNFDNGYDGTKLGGLASSSASIFAQEEDNTLQVKSSNSIIDKAFCFQANKDKKYQLTIVKSNLDKYADLQLLDLKTKTLTPVGRDTTVYSFTSEDNGDIDKRFMFVNHKTPTDIYDESSVDLLDAYLTDNNTLVINNMTVSEGIMSILDAAGSTVATGKTPIGFSKIPINLSAGVYVVAIKAGKKTKNVKIVIR